MAFIDRMIGGDERIIYRSRPHWIYLLQGFMLFSLFTALGYYLFFFIDDFVRREVAHGKETELLWYMYQSRIYVFSGCVLLGLAVFLKHFIFYRSTHIAITSDRLIYKTGMFIVDVHESALEEIKGEQVHNGFFGRFLNYGFVHIDCRFVANMDLPAIRKPYEFLHNLHQLTLEIKRGRRSNGNGRGDRDRNRDKDDDDGYYRDYDDLDF